MSVKVKGVRTSARRFGQRNWFKFAILPALLLMLVGGLQGAPGNHGARDPGVRGGPPGAGTPIAGLTASQLAFFKAGLGSFEEIDSVTGTVSDTGAGLGPRFNAEGCAQCHAQPATGGTSPFTNPQVADASDQGATNQLPFFIRLGGPVREARFPYTLDLKRVDGNVHALYTIAGRSDAPGCNLQQDDFARAASENDLALRIPTPLFGDGLIEAIPDSAILANRTSNLRQKQALGIAGRPNTSANDGTITRFGWKAQNKSLQVFAGEAYNVEIGVTNEMFNSERDQTPGCQFNPTPEDGTNFDLAGTQLPSDIVRFTIFTRFLDQPQPGPVTPSTRRGRQVFSQIGCELCHTQSFTTGQSSVAALSNVQANLYSDLLLHHMGPGLADNIGQGVAAGDEFRTAPLWGLGQRIYFLNDGRTDDLIQAIEAHASPGNHQYPASEANAVVNNYNRLPASDQQDLLNFLRSL
ncbi:MAG TPA: di-heme oxidoredictase family protein [Candidatus Binatia bacterium]|nr:di-heme oxidoredictase family protein [Candidatus Binatia bacterium]